MTLVLPFGPDQIANNPLFSGSSSARNSSMPCVFDGEPLDFESALMTDWTSDIGDYDTSADDFSVKTPSDSSDLKRKVAACGNDAHPSQSKKQRTDDDDLVSPVQSGIVSLSSSPSSFTDSHQPCTSSSTSSSTSPTFEIQSPLDISSSSSSSSSSTTTSSSSCSSSSASSPSSSSSSSSSSDGQEDDASSPAEVDDEDYMPRRRGLQMWNSRQRWKDERKKVLKMSISKLSEIEDPELCLLRSVLVNNTIKKLHLDIRNERQAKLRHRQQRMDYFAERFQPLSSAVVSSSSDNFSPDFEAGAGCSGGSRATGASSNSSDLYDETSCDEIFGISEDFLRVTIPDRRVSSPIPTGQSCSTRDDSRLSETDEMPLDGVATSRVASMDGQALCFAHSSSSPSCDTVDCASSSYSRRGSHNDNNIPPAAMAPQSPSRRLVGSVLSGTTSGGSQCATQYRTNRDLANGGEGSFPPRVPILDSVVYHSLLASLESS